MESELLGQDRSSGVAAVNWQQDPVEVKSEDTSKEAILSEPGTSGFSGLIPPVPDSTNSVDQDQTSSQILEACAEAVVQQSLDINAVPPSLWVQPDPSSDVSMETSNQSDSSLTTGFTPMRTDISNGVSHIPNAALNYCNDAIPSNMSENFRSYMSHLSQLSPDQSLERPLFDCRHGNNSCRHGNSTWDDSPIDMCSSDSEDEVYRNGCGPSPMLEHSQRLCNETGDRYSRLSGSNVIETTDHNPSFPYQTSRTTRNAWGDRRREAWNEAQEDNIYDSLNPYALFNLPRTAQRCKRRQNLGGTRSRTSDRLYSFEDENCCSGDSSRRRSSADDAQHVMCLSHPRCHDNHSCHGNEDMINSHRDQLNPSINTNQDISICRHRNEKLGYIGNQASSTTSGNISPMFWHSKMRPVFSSQESMDTASEAGELSDNDENIMSGACGNNVETIAVTRGNTVGMLQNSEVMYQDGPHGDNTAQRIAHRERPTVVRPKAIKPETGQNFDISDPVSIIAEDTSGDLETIRSRISDPSYQRAGFLSSEQTLTNPNSSESRVLHLSPGEQTLSASQMPVIKPNKARNRQSSTNSIVNNKSLKDVHNSVIKSRPGWSRSSCSTVDSTRSIDLTVSETDNNSAVRADSPVLSEVHIPSTSDDSDIEVVKIETSRPSRRRQDLSSRATVLVDLTESDDGEIGNRASSTSTMNLNPITDQKPVSGASLSTESSAVSRGGNTHISSSQLPELSTLHGLAQKVSTSPRSSPIQPDRHPCHSSRHKSEVSSTEAGYFGHPPASQSQVNCNHGNYGHHSAPSSTQCQPHGHMHGHVQSPHSHMHGIHLQPHSHRFQGHMIHGNHHHGNHSHGSHSSHSNHGHGGHISHGNCAALTSGSGCNQNHGNHGNLYSHMATATASAHHPPPRAHIHHHHYHPAPFIPPSPFPPLQAPHLVRTPHHGNQQDPQRLLEFVHHVVPARAASMQHAQLVQGSNLLQIPSQAGIQPHTLLDTQTTLPHPQTTCSMDGARHQANVPPQGPSLHPGQGAPPQPVMNHGPQHQHLHHHLHHYHHAGTPRLHPFPVPGMHYGVPVMRPFPDFATLPDFPAFPPMQSIGSMPRNIQMMRLQLGRMMFSSHRPPTYEELLHLEERLGNVNRGASQDTIEQYTLPHKYKKVKRASDDDYQEKCTICLSEFEDAEDVRYAEECTFEESSIGKWIS